MSRVESPFHAIAAQAQDDLPAELSVTVTAAVSVVVDDGAPAVTANGDLVLSRQESSAGADSRSEELGKNGTAEEEAENRSSVQERNVSLGASPAGGAGEPSPGDVVVKKSSKKRTTNVWTKTTSRKSAKKSNVKNAGIRRTSDVKDDTVLLKQWHKEDDANYPIFLSMHNKAEKIELSDDRRAASGSKGYRMVRATRGVDEGAWYFEITVLRLGNSGHARLGWSTGKGDIQAPVGYDAHSYCFRDVDGSKVHAALRETYGEAYHENDVIGFYVNVPRDENFSRKADDEVVGYKGQPFVVVSDEPLKPVPGSEILFFKNGINQGVAFTDIYDGVYYPAASMYTLPGDEACKVLFNFGPDFKYPVSDFGDRPLPNPMSMAPPPKKVETDTDAAGPTEMVAESVDGQSKQQVASVSVRVEHDDVATGADEETAPKHDEKGPPAKKKAKVSKPPVAVDLPPAVKKKPKTGESRPKLDFKPGMSKKVSKDGPGVLRAAIVPHQKVGKKVGSGAEVLRMKAGQSGNKKDVNFVVPESNFLGAALALHPVKKTKKAVQGGGVVVLTGKEKEKMSTGQSSMNGTDLGNLKRKKTESSKPPGKSAGGGKEGSTNANFRNLQGTNRSMGIAELHRAKASKKPMAGAGFLKRSGKNFQQSPAEHHSDFFPSPAAYRPLHQDFRPMGSTRMGERDPKTSRFPHHPGMWGMNVVVEVQTPSDRSG